MLHVYYLNGTLTTTSLGQATFKPSVKKFLKGCELNPPITLI